MPADPKAPVVRFSDAGVGRVRIDGALTFGSVNAKLLERSRASLQGRGDLSVDLAGVEEGDSAGLALLIEWRCWARQAGVTLRFENMPDSLRAIADISEVTAMLGLSGAADSLADPSAPGASG
jgi:phospholipid transport system transporter-binding protein